MTTLYRPNMSPAAMRAWARGVDLGTLRLAAEFGRRRTVREAALTELQRRHDEAGDSPHIGA